MKLLRYAGATGLALAAIAIMVGVAVPCRLLSLALRGTGIVAGVTGEGFYRAGWKLKYKLKPWLWKRYIHPLLKKATRLAK